jgi:DNA-nicking Smr family endonuclease
MGLLDAIRRWLSPPGEAEDSHRDDDPFDGRTDFPVTDEIDLHGLPPKLIPEIVASYLEEARRLGFPLVRIVHGRGVGVQRERVRAILARTDFVEAFDDAPEDRGGWGATLARLRPADSTPGEPPRGN